MNIIGYYSVYKHNMPKRYFCYLFLLYITTYNYSYCMDINNNIFYDLIYKPTKNIYDKIGYKEFNFPEYSLIDIVLSLEDITLISDLLIKYDDFLSKEKNFYNYYSIHEQNVQTATIVALVSGGIATVLAVVLSPINIAQISCHEYTCDDDDFNILITKNDIGGEHIYCAQNGLDYDCLKYNYQILGLSNLFQNHLYSAGCDKNLNPNLINTEIVLGTYSKSIDKLCLASVSISPYLPSLIALLPNLYTVPKSFYSYIKLKLLKNKLNTPQNNTHLIDRIIINNIVIKLKNEPNLPEEIKHIIYHVFIFYGIALNIETEIQVPIRQEVETLKNQPGFLKNFTSWAYKKCFGSKHQN